MHYNSPDHGHLKIRSTRFIRRMFAMRQLGTFLCFNPIISVLLELQKGNTFYVLLFINAFVWPWVAYRVALSSPDPTASERRNLTIDAALGGFWVAMMGISPMPSLVIMAMLASDRYAVGGWLQLQSAMRAFLVIFLPMWVLHGMPWQPGFSNRTVWLTLPLATGYMFVLSAVSYKLTLTLRRRNHELERISLMDPSLDIPNRRLFDRRLESEYLRTRRGECRAWLLLIDVDNFKAVNDTFGHEAGDYLLAEISALLRNEADEQDIPARFGGDELGVIVHDADETGILNMAKNLQLKIAQLRLPASADFHCSISIGIAAASEAEDLQQWLSHADLALYCVKRAGRNGIQLWRPTQQETVEEKR
ncbi:diguanylate cyclase [Erwiniaceae bacterium CAU 1747]